MLCIEDERWNNLTGGYKTLFDPRPSLRKLENRQDTATAWEELHHQGDVGPHHMLLYQNSLGFIAPESPLTGTYTRW